MARKGGIEAVKNLYDLLGNDGPEFFSLKAVRLHAFRRSGQVRCTACGIAGRQ